MEHKCGRRWCDKGSEGARQGTRQVGPYLSGIIIDQWT